MVERFEDDVIILEVGTNDLVDFSPEVVGSQIENLVHLLIDSYSVPGVGVCHIIPRGACHAEATIFTRHSDILRQHLGVVLDSIPNVFCWLHESFSHPAKDFYLADGVHFNPAGQYNLYRSYRGTILNALGMLYIFTPKLPRFSISFLTFQGCASHVDSSTISLYFRLWISP